MPAFAGDMDIIVFTGRLLLATVFVVSAVGKLSNRKETRQALIDFQLPVRLAAPTAFALPVAELVIAIALILTVSGWWGALAAFVLLIVATAGIGINLAYGRRPVCHCFGQLDSRPIGWKTLVRNAVFVGFAGLILLQGWTASPLERTSIQAMLDRNVETTLFAAIGLILMGTLCSGGWLIHRLQRRVASLENKLAAIALAPGIGTLAAGLAIGVRAPDFRLTGLDGEPVTLDHLRSARKPVVLVFTEIECVPCTQLLPTLGYWQRQHAAHLTIVNISRGSLEANRAKSAAYGVSSVLAPTGREILHAYRALVTPSAVSIRPDGAIGSTLALGEGAIGALLEETLNGLRDGQPPETFPAMARSKMGVQSL